jgi:two-component system OmpR family response regulator
VRAHPGARPAAPRGEEPHHPPGELLAYQPGRVFSQEQLVEHLRRSDADVASNVVEVLVSGLRKKIHAHGEAPILRTRRGFGYFVE